MTFNPPSFKVGDRVFHERFGFGDVEEIEFNRVRVLFDKTPGANAPRLQWVNRLRLRSAVEFDEIPPDLKAAMSEIYAQNEELALTFKVSYWMAYQMVSYLQLAFRHPALKKRQRDELRHYADQMLPPGSLPPILEQTLARGWDLDFDVPQDPRKERNKHE